MKVLQAQCPEALTCFNFATRCTDIDEENIKKSKSLKEKKEKKEEKNGPVLAKFGACKDR